VKSIRDVVRQILTTSLKDIEIAHSARVSKNTVRRYRNIASEKEYRWENLTVLPDDQLDAKFNSVLRRLARKRQPDFATVHAEMHTKGMTLLLLWEEYRLPSPEDALSYSQFTDYYRKHVAKLDLVMRQTHLPGKKTFVDFSGAKPHYINRETGEQVFVELFVGVLGFSNYTFATAVASQSLPDWVECHNQMFAYFGGTTELLVPDNLRSAVARAGWDPLINKTYQDLGIHFGTEIMPARSYSPQDKAKVEVGVQIVQRWILARLRKMTFFSLAEIVKEIADLLKLLNDRPFKRLPGCRRTRFEDHERHLLKPLPSEPYVLAEWSGLLLVDNSYHIFWDGHWYSVPHHLVGQRVTVRASHATVELLHQHLRVASHERSFVKGAHTTDPTHQPDAHRAYADRTPEKYLDWAKTAGPNILAVVKHQFDRSVPTLGLPACDVLRKLVRMYGDVQVEAAAQRAVEIQSLTVKSVKSLLSTGRYRQARAEISQSTRPLHHPNVRGGGYYRQPGEA